MQTSDSLLLYFLSTSTSVIIRHLLQEVKFSPIKDQNNFDLLVGGSQVKFEASLVRIYFLLMKFFYKASKTC